MRKEGLENLTVPGYTEAKRNRKKQHATYLTSLCKWKVDQGLGEREKNY